MTPAEHKGEVITVNKEEIEAKEIAIIVVVVVLVIVVPIICFVCYYQKKAFKQTEKDGNQTMMVGFTERANGLTVVQSEPESLNQTDSTLRTFVYPAFRGRMSSTGSTNSTTPLMHKFRNGSYRSRLSSTVSSRLNSEIVEGE